MDKIKVETIKNLGDKMNFQREITSKINMVIKKKKSVLLLGPRQTGKTTLIQSKFTPDISYNLLIPELRRQFEQRPDDLADEILAFVKLNQNKIPLVYIDEVQLVPQLLDIIQYIIDQKNAQFILTGSSARKLLKRKEGVNLLPGRLIDCYLGSLTLTEMASSKPPLEDLLLNGSLPEVVQQKIPTDKDMLLKAYINLYLEQEVRMEALVRDLGRFSQFLTLAAIEAGKPTNISKISEDIGVNRQTILDYFQVLEDCLIIERIEPISKSQTRKKLTRSSKYLFFDTGVRRLAANESLSISEKYYGDLFEQFVGIECLKLLKLHSPLSKLRYWKDPTGPEVDYVIEHDRQFLPIEVKYTKNPSAADGRHLKKFLAEYDCLDIALVVCRTEKPKMLAERIMAISWHDLPQYLVSTLGGTSSE